jgi:hypothetical protein
MDIRNMLAALRQERTQIDEVIVSLERLLLGRESRRGNPPAELAAPKRRGRPPGSKNRRSARQDKDPRRISYQPVEMTLSASQGAGHEPAADKIA